jgi:hypothetical protein
MFICPQLCTIWQRWSERAELFALVNKSSAFKKSEKVGWLDPYCT